MYVCMYVCFCHLHWCAPGTASHSCRLWGPTTSLTHPLHTYIPHIYKDKFHKCKCLLFNVYMYVYITSCSGDSLLRGKEDGVIHRSRVRILEPAHVEPFHSSLSSDGTQKKKFNAFIHPNIQTVLSLTLYCIMFCTILYLGDLFLGLRFRYGATCCSV
jgi:hypothetical protein